MNEENAWRSDNYPEYGYLYCECPFDPWTCEGAYLCEDIKNVSISVIAYYDSIYYNGSADMVYDYHQKIDGSHLEAFENICDFNGDGTLN
jgi:hypothetical protein